MAAGEHPLNRLSLPRTLVLEPFHRRRESPGSCDVGLVAAVPTFPAAVAACGLAGLATVIFLTTGNSTI